MIIKIPILLSVLSKYHLLYADNSIYFLYLIFPLERINITAIILFMQENIIYKLYLSIINSINPLLQTLSLCQD